MRFTKERKIYTVLIGAASAGLAALFFISGPGAAVTEAAAAAVDSDAKTAPKAVALEAETAAESTSLASRLDSFATSHKLTNWGDAFKPGAAWLPSKMASDITVVAKAADAFKAAHHLSAILLAGQKSRAIIDGQTFAIGQTLDGYKLVAVTHQTAVFQSHDANAILRVPTPDQLASADLR